MRDRSSRSKAIWAALLLALAPLPALAQQKTDKVLRVDPAPVIPPGSYDILAASLPYRDNQKVPYVDRDGKKIGYSIRRGLKIYFYDTNEKLVGRAQRVSQRQTMYYSPEGNYVGSRIDQKMQKDPAPHPVVVDPDDKKQ